MATDNAPPTPVPPANRTPYGGGSATPGEGPLSEKDAKDNQKLRDPEQQGRQGNTHQNTTHQGYQQDR